MSESAWGTSLTGLGRIRACVLRNFRHLIPCSEFISWVYSDDHKGISLI